MRRPHKKSRLGCMNCKARRTKCDEIHPTCGNCQRHSLSCGFMPAKRPDRSLNPVRIPILKKLTNTTVSETASLSTTLASRTRSSSTSPTTSPYPGYVFPATTGTPFDRALDLQLFYHYVELMTGPRMKVPGHQIHHDAFTNWNINLAFGSHNGKYQGGAAKNFLVLGRFIIPLSVCSGQIHLLNCD
jgi:hypothetical protein